MHTLIFSKYRYNEEEFINTLSLGLTTNNNESMYGILRDMVPKKARPALDAIKLGAALAIIRYNDGFNPVLNIFESFSPSDPLIRTREAFRIIENRRIMNSKNPIPWKDTVAEEQMHAEELREKKRSTDMVICMGSIPGPKGDC